MKKSKYNEMGYRKDGADEFREKSFNAIKHRKLFEKVIQWVMLAAAIAVALIVAYAYLIDD